MLSHLLNAMQGSCRPWFVAGGWALDLFASYQSRPHDDIDTALLPEDQHYLRDALPEWTFSKVENSLPGPWPVGQFLCMPVHELHARGGTESLEFLLNERGNNDWIYRRDPLIALPLARLGAGSRHGVPFLVPEVVLLYQSKNPDRDDEADFLRVMPLISERARRWLAAALEITIRDHPWLGVLASNNAP